MTTVSVDGPTAARTLRPLVAEEAADSERRRTLNNGSSVPCGTAASCSGPIRSMQAVPSRPSPR